jgi:tetratricopeptide (TPR) repeat protein
MLLEQTGDAVGAERMLRQAIGMLGPLTESRTDEPKYARNLSIAFNNLSFVLRKRDVRAAQEAAREAIGILERLTLEHKNNLLYLGDLALCYNNMAALESQQERVSEAIDWHTKAIALQERLLRMAPAVVRHRSDLAISLNNLGVAYCRAGSAAEADRSFEKARSHFETLADDFPDELAYRSSLAALLNNQALALGGAGRHDAALKIYPTAIESQRICRERLPGSEMMNEVLSKMYFNYGESLKKAGRLGEAVKASLARRELWERNGAHLVGVAGELAEIGRLARNSKAAGNDAVPSDLDNEIVRTLRDAHNSGWPRRFDLAADERFAYLHDHEGFTALLSDVNRKVGKRTASPTESLKTGSTEPAATN